MNLRKVLDEILLEGGISYNVTTGRANPKTGYMVSILGFEKQFKTNNITDKDIREFIIDNMSDLYDENRYLGGWLDNGTVYLDVSVNIDDLYYAVYIGIINKQKCIYDCSNKRDIHLPSPQTSGTETQKKEYAKMKARQYVLLSETTGI